MAERCSSCKGIGWHICNRCQGVGTAITGGGICGDCDGYGYIRCSECGGTGSFKYMEVTCPICHGEGVKICSDCGGTGFLIKNPGRFQEIMEHGRCNGTGELWECNECSRRGVITKRVVVGGIRPIPPKVAGSIQANGFQEIKSAPAKGFQAIETARSRVLSETHRLRASRPQYQLLEHISDPRVLTSKEVEQAIIDAFRRLYVEYTDALSMVKDALLLIRFYESELILLKEIKSRLSGYYSKIGTYRERKLPNYKTSLMRA